MKKISFMMVLFVGILLFLSACTVKSDKEEVIDDGGTIEGENTQKDFVYRLVSEKSVYKEGEKIQMYGELEYIGEKDKVQIAHAASPFYFNMTEKKTGYVLDYPMNEPLIVTNMTKGVPIKEDYSGAGGYSESDTEEYKKFMKRVMKGDLPKGQYEVTGVADFDLYTNFELSEVEKYQLESTIIFEVE